MDFGEKIRNWGKNNFGTLRNFAKELNLDESSLQRYLKGKTSPGKDFFEKLVKLGCDLNWLLSSESNLLIKDKQEDYNTKEDKPEECEELLQEKEQLLSMLYKELAQKTEEIKKLLKQLEQTPKQQLTNKNKNGV